MKKVIVAPLNWGLGHATRCVPIIIALQRHGIIPVLASDGAALQYLRKEFPTLSYIKLPAYQIKYKKNLILGLLFQIPKIAKAVLKEHQLLKKYCLLDNAIIGVISDNRFGMYHKQIPSVYISHQLNILTKHLSWVPSLVHQRIIEKFTECWIPDTKQATFSGKLSITNRLKNKNFIGVLSRFSKNKSPIKSSVLIVLSGVEPNRTNLEKLLLNAFKDAPCRVILVQGKVESSQKISFGKNITTYNYALSENLEKLINGADTVICRAGYTSIMDMAVLQKKVFLIPTKGQVEQEYLAQYLHKNLGIPFCPEQEFSFELFKNQLKNKVFLKGENANLPETLFRLFQRK